VIDPRAGFRQLSRMGRLLKFLLKVLLTLFIIAFFTTAWVIFDGVTDMGEKSDAVLVTSSSSENTAAEQHPLLDKASKIFRDGEVPFIIVGGGTSEAENIHYLEGRGVPSSAILKLPESATDTAQVATHAALLLKDNDLHSVMVVTEYYHMTRAKLALNHEGVISVQKAHVGDPKKEDALPVAREIIALYDYVGRMYIVPETEKLMGEAKKDTDKAKEDAQQAGKKVDKGLDSMSK
jgi:uncharacterized SAM-binding protein YcdF (DUF218 family)